MGTDKRMICEECKEYVQLDKVPFPSYWEGIDTEEWFNYPNYRYQTMKMISFVVEHQGHEIRYIPESSRYESLYFDVCFDETSEEFDIDRSIREVHKEIDE
jgi:hypothetical protein